LKFTIDKFIKNNEKGLFLLDSPTGFGKTYAVKQILKGYLRGEIHQNVDRMFFVTNLKTNLPYEEIIEELSDKEKEQCARIRSYDDDLILAWDVARNIPAEVLKSKEYKALKSDIEILADLKREKRELRKQNKSTSMKQRGIEGFKKKISTTTEPAFRNFLKKKYFTNKSSIDKKQFIKDNEWFRTLYPISELELKKVIIMTTAKFFSPTNLFSRMPFFIYDDALLNNSVVFVDEFDATKQTVLSQIIEHCLKINIDIISLFTNIHYVLQSLKFPKKLLQTAGGVDESKDWKNGDEKRYYSSEEIISLNKEKFLEVYTKNNFDLLLKTLNFDYQKSFLFDDGNHVTVYSDASKKSLSVNENREENYLRLVADRYDISKLSLNSLLWEVQNCVDYFIRGVKFLTNNYFRTLNTNKQGQFQFKYTQDEALMTVLSAFNLNGENRDYIQKMLTDGRYNVSRNENMTRKGFRFTEIEDSNYHELQSVARQFNFETTPENVIALVALKARVVGVSATATLPTVIGNYDLEYLEKVLGEQFVKIDEKDKNEIENNFAATQKIYDKVDIEVEIIDDLSVFSNKEKCEVLIRKTFSSNDLLEKYVLKLNDANTELYYYLNMIKLAYLYKQVGVKEIKSFMVFQNRIPRVNDKLDLNLLCEMFSDVAVDSNFNKFKHYIVQSENFDDVMDDVYDELRRGKKCFVISTYQTLGSGKNIQYEIPPMLKEEVIVQDLERFEKDFDGICLITPTNLTQMLYPDSEDKYNDLAKYLYQQQSLYLNGRMTSPQYKQNIVNGFRRIFFFDFLVPYYSKNSDMYCHTAQLAIQAVGRICRTRNKNRKIHIFIDMEVVDRIQKAKHFLDGRILNKEFLAVFNKDISNKKIHTVQDFSKQNSKASYEIARNAYTVRSSAVKVREWIELRDFVLKNPTAKFVPDKYKNLYFEFNEESTGYSYEFGKNFSIADLKLDIRESGIQVSAQDCELPIILLSPHVKQLFEKEKYEKSWRKNKFIMTPALYNQIYKGALGEVAGKEILENYVLGLNLEEMTDYSLFEFFDYKLGDIYFDFKHWKFYQKDPKKYIDSIKRKLKKCGGKKCFIINIVKRGNHKVRTIIDDAVIIIPYLVDPITGEISGEMSDKILNYMD